nr:MAG TPA: hypothetical protein [Caudoviricetes sp.]
MPFIHIHNILYFFIFAVAFCTIRPCYFYTTIITQLICWFV